MYHQFSAGFSLLSVHSHRSGYSPWEGNSTGGT